MAALLEAEFARPACCAIGRPRPCYTNAELACNLKEVSNLIYIYWKHSFTFFFCVCVTNIRTQDLI